MKKENIPQSRKENLVVQEINGEVLIYDLINDKAFCLNSTSALVWQACDGKRNIKEISELISRKLDTQTSEDLVWLALEQLKKEKLIEKNLESDGRFAGMSRREVVKKIGLASAVVLPVVASMVAPLAIHAASGCPTANCTCPAATAVGRTCTTPTCAPTSMCSCLVTMNPPGFVPNPGVCN